MNTPAFLLKNKDRLLRNNNRESFSRQYKGDNHNVEKVNLNALVKKQVGQEAFSFLFNYVDFRKDDVFVEATTTRFNIQKIPVGKYSTIVNLARVNDIRWINKFFETVNLKLEKGGMFIGFVETKKNRKERILNKHIFPLNWIRYIGDFLFHRAFPKIKISKRIYFYITKGNNRVLTKAETLGRLVSCGFEIKDIKEIGKITFFVTEKIKEPFYDLNPSYGPFFKMKRIGKNGKIIKVYKLRTMHPYAEYLQDYIYHLNGYDKETGKIANDFRLTTWGKFFRKLWIDELPQLINVFRGEMKLVGVRPISESLFKQYPEELKKMRIKQKPGCIPPYVALLMDEMEESMEAERIYLMEKEKKPFLTDFKYFWKALYNIITNKIRSA